MSLVTTTCPTKSCVLRVGAQSTFLPCFFSLGLNVVVVYTLTPFKL